MSAPNISDQDVLKLKTAIQDLTPFVRNRKPCDRSPALRVLDCVLGLNRDYAYFVVPRLVQFEFNNPNTKSITDLKSSMLEYDTPEEFMHDELDYRDSRRARVMFSVVNWLASVVGDGTEEEQLAKLEAWALAAHPADYIYLNIPGFGLSGFQRLRILFGANTVRPDVHVRRFVQRHLGRKASDVYSLKVIEHTAMAVGLKLPCLDPTVWQKESAKSLKSL